MKLEKKTTKKTVIPPKSMEGILIGGGKGQDHRSFPKIGVMNLTPEEHQSYK